MTFDPLSQDFARDPYPAYAALRAQGAVYYPPFDIWLLARHADVAAAALDKRLVRAPQGLFAPQALAAQQRKANWHDMPHHARFVQVSLLDSDGPVHDRLRKLMFAEFMPAAVARLRGKTERFVDGLLDGALARREIDFVEDFAAHIPGHVIGQLLGVPDSDCGLLRRWSEEIVQFFDIDRSDAKKAMAERATTEFYAYLLDAIAARRRQPQDDILSRLAAAEAAGAISHDECISTAMLVLMAGHGSSIDVMASGLAALLAHDGEMARLRSDPSLMPGAIQEMLRFDAPLPFFHRYVTEDVTLAGHSFAKGDKIGLLYGAANRDPAVFADPDRFDITRTPNRHLAFGYGAHLCLGLHLARMDMEIVFTALLRRTSAIAQRTPPVWKPGLSVRGPARLSVALEPAEKAKS